MNAFLSTAFVENVRRLALGLEPIDAGRGLRVAHPLRVVLDEVIGGLRRPDVPRHESCLHALVYAPGVADQVLLRFFEDGRGLAPRVGRGVRGEPDWAAQMRGVPRRFVPRRIRYPILTLAEAEVGSHRLRVRRPFFFPGAAYDLAAGMTGLRGRVERGGEPVRWARVVATLPGSGTVVGRAHGDDRGEFLLTVSSAAGSIGDLVDPLPVRVTVFGPAVAPVPASPDLPERDPLWDVPEERAGPLDPDDPEADGVSSGMVLPDGYTAVVARDVELRLGRLESEEEALELP